MFQKTIITQHLIPCKPSQSNASILLLSKTGVYIDINSYFVTIEQQLNPDLRDKPVVVVPLLSDSTCAIAASHEAKLLGIKTGTKIYEAKKLCPELICLEARHRIYVEYHDKIFQEIDLHLKVDHIFSIDEGACRLTGKYTPVK